LAAAITSSALAFEFRASQLVVRLRHIGVVMLAMVIIKGFGRKNRAKGVLGIGQSRKGKGHEFLLCYRESLAAD
jgi:hypothetical protein